MSLDGLIKILYKSGYWVANLMFLHFLWIVFTILGLGIFGIFPATASLVTVIYEWFNKHTDIPIFKTFFSTYKKHFIKANLLGLVFLGISVFLYIDFRISQTFIQSPFFHYFLILISVIFLIISLYLFIVFSRYDLKILQYFKQSFLIASTSPIETIAMLISVVLLLVIYYNVPFIPLLVGLSLIAVPIVWFGYQACLKVEKKKSKLDEEI